MKRVLIASCLGAFVFGCQTTSVDHRGRWRHVVTVPERAEALFRLVDEFDRRELAEGLRAKPRAGLEKRYAYELWEHPSGYSWVRRDEIIPVRTISHWYLIHPDGWVKAVTTTDHEPGWEDPQRLIKAEHRLSRYNASDLKSFKATSFHSAWGRPHPTTNLWHPRLDRPVFCTLLCAIPHPLAFSLGEIGTGCARIFA